MNRSVCRICGILLCAVLGFSLCGCGTVFADSAYFAMDTVITLRLPADTPQKVISACEADTAALEALLSRRVPESEVSRFNSSDSGIMLSPETAEILRTALAVSMETEGAYDPTVAPLAELWNVTSPDPQIPSGNDLNSVLPHIGYRKLAWDGDLLRKSDPAVSLDLGGCAKGYACASAVRLLTSSGVPMGIVSFGGNVGVFGEKPDGTPWRVGIRHPDDASASAGYLALTEGFVSVSGDYERYFEKDGVRYHHIFDTKTGYPASSGIRSAAVWSTDGTLADALSTALFVLGEEKATVLYESGIFSFEAVLYTADGRTVITPGIAGRYEHASSDFLPPAGISAAQ